MEPSVAILMGFDTIDIYPVYFQNHLLTISHTQSLTSLTIVDSLLMTVSTALSRPPSYFLNLDLLILTTWVSLSLPPLTLLYRVYQTPCYGHYPRCLHVWLSLQILRQVSILSNSQSNGKLMGVPELAIHVLFGYYFSATKAYRRQILKKIKSRLILEF